MRQKGEPNEVLAFKTKSFVSLSNVQEERETDNAGISIQIPGFNRFFAEYVMNSTSANAISATPPTEPAIIMVVLAGEFIFPP